MNIRERRAIHEAAGSALRAGRLHPHIIWIYAAVCCGLTLLSTAVSLLLSDRIAGTGGLGNIGLRSVLSTGQSVLPLVNLIVTSCLSLGYHTAILSVTRNYDTTPRTLTGGFRHFGPVLRTMLLQGLLYSGMLITATYISSMIFLATPFAQPFMEVMEPYLASITALSGPPVIDDTLLLTAMDAMVPMFWILAAVALVMILPMYYRLRMVHFALADDPQLGAFHALVKSRRLMHRNRIALFRLDLSLWWFYAAQIAISVVSYGDMLLPLLGVTFPWSNTVSYYLFYGLSLVLQMALYILGMNRAYAVYAVAYDALQEEFRQTYPQVQI